MSKYTDWVRTLPCCVSGTTGDTIDPHHIKGYNWLTGGAKAAKGTDLFCMPLRHDIHMELHDVGWESWELMHNRSQLEEVLRTLAKAEREGIITISL